LRKLLSDEAKVTDSDTPKVAIQGDVAGGGAEQTRSKRIVQVAPLTENIASEVVSPATSSTTPADVSIADCSVGFGRSITMQDPNIPGLVDDEASHGFRRCVSGEGDSSMKSVKPEPLVQRSWRVRNSRALTIDCVRSKLVENLIESSSPSICASLQHPAQACQTPGMSLSVWGRKTEETDCFVPYFAQKPINFDGDLNNLAHRIGVMCHRGHKLNSPNQDEFFLLARPESILLGVLDGHGPDGHHVAHFGQERLPTYLVEQLRAEKDWEEATRTAFAELTDKAQKEVPAAKFSGSTASVVMLDRLDDTCKGSLRVRCAFVGDSIVVHAKRKTKNDSWDWTQITDIHRPDRPDEQKRIERMGGKITKSESTGAARLETRDWSLAMSRALGDFHAAKYGLSHEPELPQEMILEDTHEHFILTCSDGIWDVIPVGQAVNFVAKFPPEEAQLAAERLVSKAQRRWQEKSASVDDITAIVLWPSFDKEQSG
jgi:serine/threonine protein phosphatase PrpC